MNNEALREEFEELARPLIKFLNDNYHPHAAVLITPNMAEILSGELVFNTDEYIKD